MRALALAVILGGLLAGPVSAQTAEEIIETAREVYTVDEPDEPDQCPTATGNEIVVCRQLDQPDDQRLTSPTERAYESGAMPPDPVPRAPYVLGLPQCGVEVTCHRIGRTPTPIYIIDLSKIPEPLTPEEAALVFRAEDLPTPEAASPAAVP
jgi:hypothetical protein